jgi:hypothetical protein
VKGIVRHIGLQRWRQDFVNDAPDSLRLVECAEGTGKPVAWARWRCHAGNETEQRVGYRSLNGCFFGHVEQDISFARISKVQLIRILGFGEDNITIAALGSHLGSASLVPGFLPLPFQIAREHIPPKRPLHGSIVTVSLHNNNF